MPSSVQKAPVATLLGDVIASRGVEDQSALFDALEGSLTRVNDLVAAVQPLQLMTGDEFQGAYETLEDALLASLLLHLHHFGQQELRIGVGWGEISVDPDRAPTRQSGPGWWFAREAIEEVATLADGQGWPKGLKTRFRSANRDEIGKVNALLICWDQILSKMDSKDVRITLGLFAGESQGEVAEALEITQPSVSVRQRANGPSALHRSQQSFRR